MSLNIAIAAFCIVCVSYLLIARPRRRLGLYLVVTGSFLYFATAYFSIFRFSALDHDSNTLLFGMACMIGVMYAQNFMRACGAEGARGAGCVFKGIAFGDWQLITVFSAVAFILLFSGRYIVDYVETGNAHHYYHPMLMLEYGNLKYIHFWTSGEPKSGTSKYVTVFFGWLLLLYSKLTGIYNSFDPTPYFYVNTALKVVYYVPLVMTGMFCYLITKELDPSESGRTGALWAGVSGTFLYTLTPWSTMIRDDIFYIVPALYALYLCIRWVKTGSERLFLWSVLLVSFAFAYKSYNTVFVVAAMSMLIVLRHFRVGGRADWLGFKAVLRREVLLGAALVVLFIPGILQPILDPQTGAMVVHEAARWNLFDLDPRIAPNYKAALAAPFWMYIWKNIVLLWDALTAFHLVPFGVCTALGILCGRKNPLVLILVVAFFIKSFLHVILVTSYGSLRYITFDILIALCLAGLFFSRFHAVVLRRSAAGARVFRAGVFFCAVFFFAYCVSYIPMAAGDAVFGRKWTSPNGSRATKISTVVLDSEWYRFYDNKVYPVSEDEARALASSDSGGFAVADDARGGDAPYVIFKDVSKVSSLYDLHQTYYTQTSDYDDYYGRIESVYLSFIPPRKCYSFIKRMSGYVRDENCSPGPWAAYDVLGIVPRDAGHAKLHARIVVPAPLSGQIDLEVIGRWAPTRRHIRRNVFHLYDNGGRLWEGADTRFLDTGDAYPRIIDVDLDLESLFEGDSYLRAFVNEVEVRFSGKIRRSVGAVGPYFFIGDVGFGPRGN